MKRSVGVQRGRCVPVARVQRPTEPAGETAPKAFPIPKNKKKTGRAHTPPVFYYVPKAKFYAITRTLTTCSKLENSPSGSSPETSKMV